MQLIASADVKTLRRDQDNVGRPTHFAALRPRFPGLQYYLGDMAAVQGGMSPDALGLYRPKMRWG